MSRDVPNPKNLPMILNVIIRGPIERPHADGAPDPHGFVYLAPGFRAHLAVCEKCRRYLQLAETAKAIDEIGIGGIVAP